MDACPSITYFYQSSDVNCSISDDRSVSRESFDSQTQEAKLDVQESLDVCKSQLGKYCELKEKNKASKSKKFFTYLLAGLAIVLGLLSMATGIGELIVGASLVSGLIYLIGGAIVLGLGLKVALGQKAPGKGQNITNENEQSIGGFVGGYVDSVTEKMGRGKKNYDPIIY